MKPMTISESFRAAIKERKVVRALFTTYSFEAGFFEREVVPLLIGATALSENDEIRHFQLQDAMRDYRRRFCVVYDMDVVDQSTAPRLEVDYVPLRATLGCQHAKISVIEVDNGEGKPTSLILAAGSFNLTRAGWFENIETGHWVELDDNDAPATILKPLRRALAYFMEQTGRTGAKEDVLVDLLRRAEQLQVRGEGDSCVFYFSEAGRPRFQDFIRKHATDTGPLEVISPFFPEDGHDATVTRFLQRFNSATVLLPLDDEGHVTMREDVYSALSDAPVTWAKWKAEGLKDFDVPRAGNQFRRVHAKIYSCRGRSPWVFVGSVNLSRSAFERNIEAGFLIYGRGTPVLLAPCKDELTFVAPEEEATKTASEDAVAMPVIDAAYDWKERTLYVLCQDAGVLTLSDARGEPVIQLNLTGYSSDVHVPALAVHLEKSSFMHATWRPAGSSASASRALLISQRNVFCRPSALPAFALQDLLHTFSGLSPAERATLIATIAAQHLRKTSIRLDQNVPARLRRPSTSNFFSEFSQVNGAFWNLNARLAQAMKDGEQAVLDYYLKGCQPDSLRGVLEALKPAEDRPAPSAVVCYLTLLSVEEMLDRYVEHADAALREQLPVLIEAVERDEELSQIPNRERFLAFFKQRFRTPVRQLLSSVKGD